MMKLNNYLVLFSMLVALFVSLPNAEAQLVNMEETWQEFLRETKTSNVSKLVKPEKSQPANYIKYSLMYANSYFCADNIESADKMMREIESMGKEIQDRVPGFEERYLGLKSKIKAYKNLLPIWERFLKDPASVTRADVAKVPEAQKVCEKGTLCKSFYMISHAYYCEGNLEKSRERFENRVLKLAATSFDPKNVEGLDEEIEKMKAIWAGIDKLDPAWSQFIQSDVSPGYEGELPLISCYPIPNMKVYVLQAVADVCGTGEELLKKIKALEASNTHPVPADLADKIAWLEEEVNKSNKDLKVLNEIWAKFTPKGKVPAGATYMHSFFCDRSADVKAYIMDGLQDPCKGGKAALDSIAAVRKRYRPALDNVTTTYLKKLQKMVNQEADQVEKLDEAWADFVPDNKLSGSADFGFEYCDKASEIKAYTMDGILNICERGQQRLEDIERVKAEYSPDLESEVTGKVNLLEKRVKKNNADIALLNKAWSGFLESGEVDQDLEYEHEFECDRAAEVKAYLLDGYINPCLSGQYALDNIKKVRDKHNPTLDAETKEQLQELKDLLENEKENLATLNRAWKDFLPDNQLDGEIDFVFEYCDKIAQVRAYIIDGTINFCTKAGKRLADISKLQKDYLITLDKVTSDKLEDLFDAHERSKKNLANLEAAWELCVKTDVAPIPTEGFPEPDTVVRYQIELVSQYCDKIAQTKSWTILGLLDPCDEGDKNLKRIDDLRYDHNLKYDEELTCQVQRLRAKVYQCKYWKLVLEARKITHQERETFGPKSAQIMYNDLNSDKQPCETTVTYEPLGYIGVKYVVSPSLCQKTNLAKMGDPEYYKKIASWVDREALNKYCESNMRCKEDFFIYLEGHTDGHRFSGRKYDQSLDVPEGTPYTHFLGNNNGTVDTLQKTTRHITRELKSNMELGIARAWTVKGQLDFMNVPITIGAYEHPSNEKGGEFRKIDIEMNMTNLLLDFYEKTLARLIKEEGIGKRPSLGC